MLDGARLWPLRQAEQPRDGEPVVESSPPQGEAALVDAVARVFGVSEQTVRNWVDRGVLPGTRTFGTGPRRIPRAVLATAESFQRTASLPVPNFTPADIEDLLARSPRRRA